MESNGQPNCIHVSQSTADALTSAGKGHWVTAREDKIKAKGKGYETSAEWTTDVLVKMLPQIIARRDAAGTTNVTNAPTNQLPPTFKRDA